MKAYKLFIYFALSIMIARVTIAQGTLTFVYDQQSASELDYDASGGGNLQYSAQSFTPILSSVGFVQLEITDFLALASGALISMNLRADSVAGPIIGTAETISVPAYYEGAPDFVFPSPVAVDPGTTYYFQPFVQSGDAFAIFGFDTDTYPGGNAYYNGNAQPANDFWFREGIVVPEPEVWSIMLLGVGLVPAARAMEKIADLERKCRVK